MKDKDGLPIVSLPAKHIQNVKLEFSDEERIIYDLLFKNAKSKFLGYQASGSVLQSVHFPLSERFLAHTSPFTPSRRNVTAIFSILMRLRQAVLHPTLVLKRLVQNLATSKKEGGRSKADRALDAEDEAIKRLISRFSESRYQPGSAQNGSDELMLLDDEDEDVPECSLCLDVSSQCSP